jgi:catechol 2,3-dioxygenase-like lactoylglutathione lyase family enzyme
MPKYWFHHVHIKSSDQQKTAEFCERILGSKTLYTRQAMINGVKQDIIDINLNGTQIDLMAPGPEPPTHDPGYRGAVEHICLRTDDLEAAVEELKAAGARPLRPILPANNPDVKHSVAYFLIPGDVTIELNDIPEGD